MADRENRREQMLDAAAALFEQRGYQATSVRQIAERVGCTEAALYYHFKGGKRELLQQVLATVAPDFESALDNLQDAESLRDLIMCYGQAVAGLQGGKLHRTLRWLVSEFQHLQNEERDLFYERLLSARARIASLVLPFIRDSGQADEIAWLLLSTSFGYRQLFIDLEIRALAHQDVTHLFQLLADGLCP